ncbi:hypothetical protein MKW92_044051 [Papaver armeniacum]|nr:hypothetical protein MKW92_044051 [Papaver armeniacum]
MMLKVCNADVLQILAHSRFSPKTKTPFRGISVVSCGLLEDGLSYKENFIVRCYEVGINKTAIVETMPNLLQLVEFGRMNAARGSRMHIEIYKYPAWGDEVEIETWCQSEGRTGTKRDWILKDFASGVVIRRATRTLQKVNDDVRDEYLVFCPRTPHSLKKIPKLEEPVGPVQYSKLGLVPSRADLDMNQRVNNVTYFGWVLEHDNAVDSLTSPEMAEDVDKLPETNGSVTGTSHEMGTCQFLHFSRLSGEGLELNRVEKETCKMKRCQVQFILFCCLRL